MVKHLHKPRLEPLISSSVENPHATNADFGKGKFMLPADRNGELASSAFQASPFSVFLRTRRSETRGRPCQDTAFALVRKKYALIGVADGFGDDGEIFSDSLARAFMETSVQWSKMQGFAITAVLGIIMQAAVNRVTARLNKMAKAFIDSITGGTTLTVALVLPDGHYAIAMIGDSEPYLIRSDGRVVRAIGHQDKIIVPHIATYYAVGLDIHTYLKNRHVIGSAVMREKELVGVVDKVLYAEGRLHIGEVLFIASDGFSKNLMIGTENGLVVDCSGCEDFGNIVKYNHPGASLDKVGELIGKTIRYRATGKTSLEIKNTNGTARILRTDDDDISISMLARR